MLNTPGRTVTTRLSSAAAGNDELRYSQRTKFELVAPDQITAARAGNWQLMPCNL
jgi:hypothetical protein